MPDTFRDLSALPPPMPVEPVELHGQGVRLLPLAHEDHDGLVEAARDGELWRRWYTFVPTPEGMAAEIERRLGLLAAGSMIPFTTWRRDAQALGGWRICGMTTYMNIDAANHHVEIGSTWLAASAQRTGVNAEAKLLMLAHAFQTLDAIAVEFRTHWHNTQSRDAIARLGAKQDGVLRNHQYAPDGSLRDTVCFSIIASEWPAVRAGLNYRLGR